MDEQHLEYFKIDVTKESAVGGGKGTQKKMKMKILQAFYYSMNE